MRKIMFIVSASPKWTEMQVKWVWDQEIVDMEGVIRSQIISAVILLVTQLPLSYFVFLGTL